MRISDGGNVDVLGARLGQHRLLGDQAFQRLGAGGRRVEQLGVHLAAEHLLQPLDLLAVGLIERLAGDLLAVDHRHLVAAADHLVVSGHAEEDECRQDEEQYQAQHDPLVFANCVEHVSLRMAFKTVV